MFFHRWLYLSTAFESLCCAIICTCVRRCKGTSAAPLWILQQRGIKRLTIDTFLRWEYLALIPRVFYSLIGADQLLTFRAQTSGTIRRLAPWQLPSVNTNGMSMPKQDVEFTKEGIKISYLRLLSDSAAGFMVILFGVAAYYLPVYGVPLQKVYNVGMSTEAKILLIVLLTLFATPLGINAMSWLLPFGRVQMRMQKYWFDEEWRLKLVKKDWLVRPIKDEFAFDTHTRYFDLTSRDVWYGRSQLVKQAMYIYHPEVTDGFEHLRGSELFYGTRHGFY